MYCLLAHEISKLNGEKLCRFPTTTFKPFQDFFFSVSLRLLLDLVFNFIQLKLVGPIFPFPRLSVITNQSINFALETQVAAVLFPSNPKQAVLPFN